MDDKIIENLLKDKDSPEFKETIEKIRYARQLFESRRENSNTPKPSVFVKHIGYEEFNQTNPKIGLFGFVNGEICSACAEYLKNMKNLGSIKKDLIIVELSKNEQQKLKEQDGITTPFTRIYNENELIWEREGILYDSQFNGLFKAYRSIQTKEPIHTMDEFALFEAYQRPLKVQAFEAREFINLEILGRHITARAGQMVVYWPDNADIKVMDKSEFAAKFSETKE